MKVDLEHVDKYCRVHIDDSVYTYMTNNNLSMLVQFLTIADETLIMILTNYLLIFSGYLFIRVTCKDFMCDKPHQFYYHPDLKSNKNDKCLIGCKPGCYCKSGFSMNEDGYCELKDQAGITT